MKIYFLFLFLSIFLVFCDSKPIKQEQIRITFPMNDSLYIVQNYEKIESYVPMRDRIKLFTQIYFPKDTSKTFPILFKRTPYGIFPYGKNQFPLMLGSNPYLLHEKYIFVFQDVRGRFMSEGEFVDVRPLKKNSPSDVQIDESTDAYDTIEWLLKNVKNNNGKVGMYGNSYAGFYALMAAIDGHLALKVIVPQCPVSDWFFEDFHHNGAFFLCHFLDFHQYMGQKREGLTKNWVAPLFEIPEDKPYEFFLNEVGALSNVDKKFYKNKIAFWKDITNHPNYDDFWKNRSLIPNLKSIKAAVMTVGGFFDAENLYSPTNVYEAIEKNNPNITNILVIGPWFHGGFYRSDGLSLGKMKFGKESTSIFYLKEVETPFLNHFLKDKPLNFASVPEILLFETGKNQWRYFDSWIPKNISQKKLFLGKNHSLNFDSIKNVGQFDEFISDPNNPVPYTEYKNIHISREYMAENQDFVSQRKDVLTYETEILQEDLTFAGKINVDLFISTSQSDADWVVKIIDVFPDTVSDSELRNYKMLVRSEVFRSRFRNSLEKPEPLIPNQTTEIKFNLQDVLHTFSRGHKISVQIQSTWFPLVDRNPQKYIENIYLARDKDFTKATHRVYFSKNSPSYVTVNILKN